MKKRIPILIVVLALLIGMFGITTASAEPRMMEVDYDEYSLWLDEVPEGIWESTYIAAKLLKTSLDPEMYMLTMIDDVDSINKLHKAMSSAKVDPEKNRSFAMDVRLYEYDEDEGDYYLSDDSDVEVIVPVADNMFQYDEDDEPYLQTDFLKVVNVNSSGKLGYPTYELVSVDDIICAKFKITDNAVYGFILNGVTPEFEEDEEEYVPTATPTPKPTATPTPKPTSTPTPKPTSKPTSTPTPTKAAGGSQSSTSQKDDTPKTGDDHNSTMLLLLGSVSAITLVAVAVAWKKEEREEA